jgi:mycothiol S-conjugate amidase
MTHRVSTEAFEAAADPERYQDCGEPWQPLKLYYFISFHRARFTALHEKMLEHGLESPYAERVADKPEDADKPARKTFEITTMVPCGEYFALRDQALLAHATQVDPNGGWFTCPINLQQEAWPTEDYHLARSVVDADTPEDDLFAGIREKVRC